MEIERYNNIYEVPQNENYSEVQQSGLLLQYQNQQIYAKDQEIKSLNAIIEQKNQKLALYKASYEYLSQQDKTKTENLIQEQIEKLKSENSKLIKENDNLRIDQKSEAQFRVELDHLRGENQILNNLLGRKDGNLENFQQQSTQVELKLLKKNVSSKPENQSKDYCYNCTRYIYYYRPCCNLLANIDDKLLLVPQGAYNFAQAFKEKYISSKNDLLVDEVFELLLFELNKFWLQREQTSIFRIKKACDEKITKLIRAHDNKTASEKEVFHELARLQSKVKDLQNENMNHYLRKWEPRPVKI